MKYIFICDIHFEDADKPTLSNGFKRPGFKGIFVVSSLEIATDLLDSNSN